MWGHGDATGGLRASATSRPPAARASLCLSGVAAGCRRKKRRFGREVPGGVGSPSIRRELEQRPGRSSPTQEVPVEWVRVSTKACRLTVGTRGISHVCPPCAVLRLRDVSEVRWGQVYHGAELLAASIRTDSKRET